MHFEMADLVPLVKELSEKYTSKDSTSITYEKAAQLMEGILYCIAESEGYEKDYEGGYDVKTNQSSILMARDAYQAGYERVIQKVVAAQHLYNKMIVDFYSFGSMLCEDTVTKAIPGFFQWYDAKFCPQDSIITFDYPILIHLGKKCGIDAIYLYINCIIYEQIFLQQMPREYVKQVLRSTHHDFEEQFINLCRPVMKKLLMNLLLALPVQKIELDREDYQKTIHLIRSEGREAISEKLYQFLKQIMDNAYGENDKLFGYLKNGIPDIVTELYVGAENDCMEIIF